VKRGNGYGDERMRGTGFIEVRTTLPSRTRARALGKELVERRLAACVQILGPLSSRYWWKGKIEGAEEWLCIAKVRKGSFRRVSRFIAEHHPYDVPEIVAVPIVAASRSYRRWLDQSIPPEEVSL